MQAVDVLGDDRRDRTAADELGDGAVTAVRLRFAKGVLHRKAPSPGLAPRLLRSEKVRKVDRRHARPDSTGAAEIGDPRFSAYAGAREDDGAACPGDRLGE